MFASSNLNHPPLSVWRIITAHVSAMSMMIVSYWICYFVTSSVFVFLTTPLLEKLFPNMFFSQSVERLVYAAACWIVLAIPIGAIPSAIQLLFLSKWVKSYSLWIVSYSFVSIALFFIIGYEWPRMGGWFMLEKASLLSLLVINSIPNGLLGGLFLGGIQSIWLADGKLRYCLISVLGWVLFSPFITLIGVSLFVF